MQAPPKVRLIGRCFSCISDYPAESRQAISKWELGSSLPDTENVIQLSKLFGVSTDYLLKDEIENDADISTVNINENDIKEETLIKTSFTIGIGIVLIGLLISFIGWRTYQTEIA